MPSIVAATVLACASIQAGARAGRRSVPALPPGRVRRPAGRGDDRLAPRALSRSGPPAAWRSTSRSTPTRRSTALFVTDQTTGRMIPAGDAWFVPTVLPVPERQDRRERLRRVRLPRRGGSLPRRAGAAAAVAAGRRRSGGELGETRDCSQELEGLRRLIGNTPLLAIHYRWRGRAGTVYAKSEQLNLTGSIKDRMALHILDEATRDGTPRAAATPSSRRPAAIPGSRLPRSAAPSAIR